MASRPPDFKASGLRAERIIASGSSSNPRLLIIGSGSTHSDGVTVDTSTIVLTGTGSDTWLFISGAIGGTDRVTFGGDVFISGTLIGGGGGGGGGSSNWNELSPSPRLNSTASVAVAGGLGSSYAAQSAGSDVFFFVSGTSGGTTTSNKKSVFGGDLTVSGVLSIPYGVVSGSGDLSIFFGSVGSANELYIRDPNNPTNRPIATFNGRTAAYSLELSGGLVVNGQQTTGYGDFLVYGKGSGTSILSDSTTGNLFLSGNQVTVNKMSVHGGADVNFFVSGSRGSIGSSTRGTSAFSGDVFISGSAVLGAGTGDKLVVGSLLASDIIPDGDRTRNLGSASSRFANIYTGDLHLRNERGDWTVIEEPEFLTVTNNKTGKRFKILMEPID